MENFVKFLSEYKELLVSVLCVLLAIIAMIIKRRPKTLDEFIQIVFSVCQQVPSMVLEVECPGNGETKKRTVIVAACQVVSSILKRDLTDKEIQYCEKIFGSLIESILAAPQKKGVSDETR